MPRRGRGGGARRERWGEMQRVRPLRPTCCATGSLVERHGTRRPRRDAVPSGAASDSGASSHRLAGRFRAARAPSPGPGKGNTRGWGLEVRRRASEDGCTGTNCEPNLSGGSRIGRAAFGRARRAECSRPKRVAGRNTAPQRSREKPLAGEPRRRAYGTDERVPCERVSAAL